MLILPISTRTAPSHLAKAIVRRDYANQHIVVIATHSDCTNLFAPCEQVVRDAASAPGGQLKRESTSRHTFQLRRLRQHQRQVY